MKVILFLALGAGVAFASGCATVEPPATTKTAVATTKDEPSKILGSRLPRTTTDRHVRSTERDRADEPVRSIGNSPAFSIGN